MKDLARNFGLNVKQPWKTKHLVEVKENRSTSVHLSNRFTQNQFSFYLQLFERAPVERLGYRNGTNPNIRFHKFFERINWTKLEQRKIDPPFKPSVVSEFLY